MTSRKEHNQDEIISLIEQWHKSGKNKAEFCKKESSISTTIVLKIKYAHLNG